MRTCEGCRYAARLMGYLIIFLCAFLPLSAEEMALVHSDIQIEDVIDLIDPQRKTKTPKKIKVERNGDHIYAKYSGHSRNEIRLTYRDEELVYKWKNFGDEELLDIIDSFGINGAGYLLMAQYSLAQHMPKEAKRYCAIAKRKDTALNERVNDLLTAIKVYEKDRKTSRYNHDGRKLPALPDIDKPVFFNDPEADRIMASIQMFPKDSPWNEDISKHPVHPRSDRILKKIGINKTLLYDFSHNFIIVPPDQRKVSIKITDYVKESSSGPAPIPVNMPVEGWPKFWDKKIPSLESYQTANNDGDRHGYIIDPWNNMVYEFFRLRKTAAGWQASSATYWRLDRNQVLPDTYTSADAAGLSLMAGIIRYDELERGKVEHAIRVTFRKTRKAFIYPASHFASHSDDLDLPAMGQRFRLKKDIDTSDMSKQALAIVYALQKYGAICADNGSDWYLSGVIDERIDARLLKSLARIKSSDFEVIQTTPKP